jgi:hypothetical protein
MDCIKIGDITMSKSDRWFGEACGDFAPPVFDALNAEFAERRAFD